MINMKLIDNSLPKFGKMIQECKKITHDNKDGTWPCLHHISNLDDKLMF